MHEYFDYTFFLIYFQDLHKRKPEQFPCPVIQGMLQFDWDIFIDKKRKVGFLTYSIDNSCSFWYISTHKATVFSIIDVC